MRAHGIPDFPDPNSDGQIQLEAHPGSDLDFNSPKFQAAQQACRSLEPGHGNPQQQAQDRVKMLKYSQCMRDHGIKDFPDPNPQGGLMISAAPGGDLDPNSPQFQAAQKACQSLMPGGKGGPGGGPGLNSKAGS